MLDWKLDINIEAKSFEGLKWRWEAIKERIDQVKDIQKWQTSGASSNLGGQTDKYYIRTSCPPLERAKRLRQEADELEKKYNSGLV